MTTQPKLPNRFRSWLFAPGDSERKMTKAAEGEADIVIFDIEDAVAEDAKPAAREAIRAFLLARSEEERSRLWVRVNPLDGPHTADDIAAILPGRPGGIMLMPATTTFGVYAQVPVTARLAVVLRGENLFDEEIVTRNQGGSIDLGVPRTVWAGIKLGL